MPTSWNNWVHRSILEAGTGAEEKCFLLSLNAIANKGHMSQISAHNELGPLRSGISQEMTYRAMFSGQPDEGNHSSEIPSSKISIDMCPDDIN